MKTIIKRSRGWLVVSVIFYVVCAFLETEFALILGDIIDNANAGQMSGLIKNIVTAIAIMLGSLILSRIAIEARRRSIMKSISDIKEKLMESFYKRGIYSFRKKPEAYYINILSNDMDIIENDYLSQIPILFLYIAQFTFAVVALLVISWKSTVIFTILFLIPMVLPQLLAGKLSKLKKDVSEKNEEFMFMCKEQIQGSEVIISNLAEKAFFNKFVMANKEQQYARKQAGVLDLFMREVSNTCGFIAHIGCIAVGGVLVINGEIRIGELIAQIQLLNSVFNPINAVAQIMTSIKATKPIQKKINQELEACDNNDKEEIEDFASCDIEYKDVCVEYDNKEIIKNFSYKFNDGGVYAVVGKSGSGKTSLFKCLMKYHEEYKGEVLVGNKDINKIGCASLYKYIGYVSQDVFVFNDTIENNITLGENYSQEEINRVLEKVALSDLVHKQKGVVGDLGKNMSGGEKQRLGLARVLLRNPKVIIFDEPTSSLDSATRDDINKLIFELAGYTRIVITHDKRMEYLNEFNAVVNIENDL